MDNPPAKFITTSEIAALAGVDISTVSNWRKRFSDDFPRPEPADDVLGKRPRFNHHKIVAWLDSHPEVGAASPPREDKVTHVLDALRTHLPAVESVDLIGRLLAIIAEKRRSGQRVSQTPASVILDWINAPEKDPVNGTVGTYDLARVVPPQSLEAAFENLLSCEDPAAEYDSLLERFTRVTDSGDHSTPGPIADFVLALVPTRVPVAIDPASGFGELLIRGLQKQVFERGVGVDRQAYNVEVAKRRFKLHDVNASAVEGDSLFPRQRDDQAFDLVLADVPVYSKLEKQVLATQRWDFGLPTGAAGDFAWLQKAIALLSDDGRAIVVTGVGPLFRSDRASTAIRGEMIRRGSVEAVIALPGGMRPSMGVRLAIWILRRPEQAERRNSVLLIDAGEVPVSDLEPEGRIAASVREWLESGKLSLDSTIAAAVSVTDLLAPGANLMPNRWTATKVELLNPSQWQSRVNLSYKRASEALAELLPLPEIRLEPGEGQNAMIKIGDLVEEHSISILRGRYAERVPAHTADTYRVLTTMHARPNADLTAEVQTVLRNPATDAQVVRPGDVLVYIDSDVVAARVWDQEGWVLGRFMQALRVKSSEWIPEYLAAAITNPANARYLVGTAVRTHFDLRQFEILALPLQDQRHIADLDREMKTTLQRLREASLLVGTARQDFVTAATVGTIKPSTILIPISSEWTDKMREKFDRKETTNDGQPGHELR